MEYVELPGQSEEMEKVHFPTVKIGFRVYRPSTNQYKIDEVGTYEGWSDKYDDWIPIYSPRIMPFDTKSGKQKVAETDFDDDLDSLIMPEAGQDRVYAVPRSF